MRLYVGARDYRPFGYKTVDIDPQYKPDILADITNMHQIANSSCSEVVASHVMEHISWPDSFLAMTEFSRILKIGGIVKIAVPDVISLLHRIAKGAGDFWAMGLIYGVGGRENDLEIHRYGFTQKMLIDILGCLGFDSFQWWNSAEADASNGWMPLGDDRRTAISLNLAATKKFDPLVPGVDIFNELVRNPLQSVESAVSTVAHSRMIKNMTVGSVNEGVYQDIHYKLIEANQRIAYLEKELAAKGR